MVGVKKNLKYPKEQKEIYYKLLNLINLNGDYSFNKYTLENDRELQENILNLTADIKRYYSASSCKGVNNKVCKRDYFSIIRFVLKENDKELYKNDITMIVDNKNIQTIKYKIFENNYILNI